MANLLVVCGLPGTGKSTLAKKVADKINGTILRTDVIRRELEKLDYAEEEKQKVYDEMFGRAKKLLKEGRSVVLDATFDKRKNRQTASNFAQDLRADFKLIEVVCPEKIIKERLMKRKGDASEAKFKHYLEHKKSFQPVKEKHLIIDTSQDIDKQLSRI